MPSCTGRRYSAAKDMVQPYHGHDLAARQILPAPAQGSRIPVTTGGVIHVIENTLVPRTARAGAAWMSAAWNGPGGMQAAAGELRRQAVAGRSTLGVEVFGDDREAQPG